MERLDAWNSRWPPRKEAVELASDSRMQNSENVGCSKDSKLPKAKPIELGTSSELELFKPWSLVGGFGLEVSSEALIAQDRCAKAPNDPKLSDGRGWRDRCVAGERRRPEAAGVTARPVRYSAWIGVADFWKLVIKRLLPGASRSDEKNPR